ncbi:large exoprotein [Microbacterium fluvii]|uniref:Large exoprotein n=1 Tax=Microbacterium fluvii TaxID=415215 RepID=A0ABW2HB03_9MICO|nr:large exoprotein [Microbacterium fluvii]MCU4671878.1 large exoprotein [Microbacterium fluvii]
MGGQVLGGGVVVLVAVLLWLVYLLPSWHSRRQYDAVERNAVRLNQALRVLAETSSTPQEVQLELTARTALAQQRLARQAMAQREQAALAQAKVDLERAKLERIAASESPEARRARARRRVRLLLTVVAMLGIVGAGTGAWLVVDTGAQGLLWSSVAVVGAAALLLRRMSRVTARAAVRTVAVDAAPQRVAGVQDVDLVDERTWQPRSLPRPLTASAGSRAAVELDAVQAREALQQAALEEAMRARAEARRPPSIQAARIARTASDAEIEAHVRELLAQRAVGQ